MLKVDLSNVWGDLSLPDLLATEQEVFAAHKTLAEGRGPGNDFLGWLELPTFEETEELQRIRRAAERIRADSDVFVVVGIGGSYLGPRAAIELVKGQNHNLKDSDPQVFFAGNNLSTRAWQELCELLEGKDFSINIISKSGTTTEPAIATRALRWMLERKYGAEKAKKRIYVTTDSKHGALRQMATEQEVFAAHKTLAEGRGPGNDFLGWLELPTFEETEELQRIRRAAERIRADSDVFVVVGIGGSYLGPRAAIELVKGQNHNLKDSDPQVFFAGNNLSTRAWQELCELLEGKDFSINIISKSGTTTEPAIATRALRWMLERKYGAEKAKKRIYVTTDSKHGALRQMATEEGYESFIIPPNVGGRYSVLTAVGLLPMAVAGIAPMDVMLGAARARKELDIRSFENPAWQYAAIRNLLYRRGKAIELLGCYEPSFRYFAGWWQQLFGESEGKDGKGLFPATVEFTADLHSLGQMIQQGQRNLFETIVRFAPPRKRTTIEVDWKNLDGLNYLEGKTLDFVEEQAFQGTLSAHVDGGVPNIVLQTDEVDADTLGELFYFFELSCGISAYMLGVNPFNQPGVEFYKKNMFHLLGKPGY